MISSSPITTIILPSTLPPAMTMISVFPLPLKFLGSEFCQQVSSILGPQYQGSISCQAFPKQRLGCIRCPTTMIRDSIISKHPVLFLTMKASLNPTFVKKTETYDIYVSPLPDTLSSEQFESQVCV